MSAALRSIVVKSTLVPHLGSVDFATERETIRRFLVTPAFMLIEYDLAKNNIESVLRISLIIISESSSVQEAAKFAIPVEKELSKFIKNGGIAVIDAYMRNFSETITNMTDINNISDLTKTSYNVVNKISTRTDGIIESKLRYLKEQDVKDPDIDLFIAVFDNNLDAVKLACDNGANVNVRDVELLKKYEDKLKDFK